MWYSYVFEIGGPIEMNVLNPLIMKFGVFFRMATMFYLPDESNYFLMQYIIN